VAGAGVILGCPPRGAVHAIKARSATDPADAEFAWEAEALSLDVPTPLFYQGDFFVLSDLRKTLARVEPATGNVKWSIKAPGRAKYEASPTGADGRVYLINAAGEVSVVDAENGAVLRTIPMGEDEEDMVRSTVAVAQGQLFIRTSQRLYCVGRK
jgi:outer membrane protein assembly factor BamB